MSEVNMVEAFGRYKVKPSPRARSAMTRDGELVVSCWYARFHRAEADVLRYEEDISQETGGSADKLRAHLAEALEKEYEIRLIVAVAPAASKPVLLNDEGEERPKQTTFHARMDLHGRVTFYDGKRFIIEFRKQASNA